jgi:hypothetical protein
MAVLGTFDSPVHQLLGMLALAGTCVSWAWFFGRSALRRELQTRAEEYEKLSNQLTEQDAKYREALRTIEQLGASLRAAQEEAQRCAREMEEARSAPRGEIKDTTLFPAENGVASPISENRVASLVFPAVMGGPPLDRWRGNIEEGIRSGNPDAGILAAELHVVAACEGGEPDSRLLLGALKEVSRYLVRFLASAGGEPAQIVEELTAWAEQFNSVAQGRYSIQVPRLGASVDLGYASPKPGVKTVSSVLTWAVRNANGVAEFKAEVS